MFKLKTLQALMLLLCLASISVHVSAVDNDPEPLVMGDPPDTEA